MDPEPSNRSSLSVAEGLEYLSEAESVMAGANEDASVIEPDLTQEILQQLVDENAPGIVVARHYSDYATEMELQASALLEDLSTDIFEGSPADDAAKELNSMANRLNE